MSNNPKWYIVGVVGRTLALYGPPNVSRVDKGSHGGVVVGWSSDSRADTYWFHQKKGNSRAVIEWRNLVGGRAVARVATDEIADEANRLQRRVDEAQSALVEAKRDLQAYLEAQLPHCPVATGPFVVAAPETADV